jgi:hypothetical protein
LNTTWTHLTRMIFAIDGRSVLYPGVLGYNVRTLDAAGLPPETQGPNGHILVPSHDPPNRWIR